MQTYAVHYIYVYDSNKALRNDHFQWKDDIRFNITQDITSGFPVILGGTADLSTNNQPRSSPQPRDKKNTFGFYLISMVMIIVTCTILCIIYLVYVRVKGSVKGPLKRQSIKPVWIRT